MCWGFSSVASNHGCSAFVGQGVRLAVVILFAPKQQRNISGGDGKTLLEHATSRQGFPPTRACCIANRSSGAPADLALCPLDVSPMHIEQESS